MKKKILALCDHDREYAQNMGEYLRSKEDFPYEIVTYSDTEKLLTFHRDHPVDVLLVAETDYTYELRTADIPQKLLLNESGTIQDDVLIPNIDKFQMAEKVYKQIVEQCMEDLPEEGDTRLRKESAVIIGFYSPVKRSLQTSFALTMGQLLAKKYRVLYLSLERFAGWNRELVSREHGDILDLLYFRRQGKEKLKYRLDTLTESVGILPYIPPAYNGENLLYVSAEEWIELIQEIADIGKYHYIILDLGDSVQGLYDIMQLCDHIYTMVKEDEHAQNKVNQYERLLLEHSREELLDKIHKCNLPIFQGLPGRVDQYTKGELAANVKTMLREDLGIYEI